MNRLIKSSFSLILFSIVLNPPVFGQNNKKQKDINAIKSMEGCYHVSFKYTETFAPEIDYEKAYDYTSAGIEWAKVIEETDDKIVLQHILVVDDSVVIKHWRQDWTYEKQNRFDYKASNEWIKETKTQEEVDGQWTQEVFQVDDGPRYSGSATWTHVDGNSSWFDIADSPLPRREYTKRDDYNVLVRGNRVKIQGENWIHEQDNDKIIRKAGEKDQLLVQEKGYNTYTKRPEADCQSAKVWWSKNKTKWAKVRSVWADVYQNHDKALVLNEKSNDKRLYEYLFMGTEYNKTKEIKKLIEEYVVN